MNDVVRVVDDVSSIIDAFVRGFCHYWRWLRMMKLSDWEAEE